MKMRWRVRQLKRYTRRSDVHLNDTEQVQRLVDSYEQLIELREAVFDCYIDATTDFPLH